VEDVIQGVALKLKASCIDDGGGCGVCRAGYADERCWQGLYFSLQYPHHSVKIVFLLLYFSALL
jgi:hypothetical protein